MTSVRSAASRSWAHSFVLVWVKWQPLGGRTEAHLRADVRLILIAGRAMYEPAAMCSTTDREVIAWVSANRTVAIHADPNREVVEYSKVVLLCEIRRDELRGKRACVIVFGLFLSKYRPNLVVVRAMTGS